MNTTRSRRIWSDSESGLLESIGLPGTSNRIVKFSGSGLADSSLLDTAGFVSINSGTVFSGESQLANLYFGTTGSEYFALGVDGVSGGNPLYSTAWVYGDESYAQLGYGESNLWNADNTGLTAFTTNATATAQFQLLKTGTYALFNANGSAGGGLLGSPGDITLGDSNHTQIELKDNSVGTGTSGNITKYSTFIGNQNSTIASGVINSVILGGTGLYGKTNNTAYVNQIGYATGSTNETLLSFTAPSGNRAIIFEDASGRVLAASAVTTEAVASDRTLTVVFNGTTYKLLARA